MATTTKAPAKICIPMADYGNDPTETAIPYKFFTEAGFVVHFVTENGNSPRCDSILLTGMAATALGASKEAKDAYQEMIAPAESASATSTSTADGSIAHPLSWTSADFSLEDYDLVFLPGGHDKGMRQIIDSKALHKHLASYFPQTRRVAEAAPNPKSKEPPKKKKHVAAICHGVQILAAAQSTDPASAGKSILHATSTTALPAFMEQSAFQATRLFLGDYYKTYGYGSESVEAIVKSKLDDPATQWKATPNWNWAAPWIYEDEYYRYVSARYPPDAWMIAKRAVDMIKITQNLRSKGW